ncbi:hypothetical protein GTA62_10145 [Roseobacter sp. HKCCD9010]|uniref:hypothetical protein n=1 Tax=unclassified Roseobacter TaxID=196798 RepID=UPI001490C0D2|nr:MULTISPECIES: hypothetical protein [unclassified Roseobacter]MBF9050931.1 hypothetical protein [Rhodobacterales bacterium HKCCD4356]NNV77337.1 hypothetical protein [Roseobacter sp. HKCCD6135]NNW32623.1 hypothetical protein [Roseobacter sp. HKCCD8198]NNZ77884.1 hypothetical protein [Roseobacter sp. HKCCD8214]NNV12700.1 hypothetical protein [Roseobacter sp. HKCCD7357]
MTVPHDILLVIATLVTGLALASIFSAWADKIWPVRSIISLVIALGLFAFVHLQTAEGLTLVSVPDAFVSVAARILN